MLGEAVEQAVTWWEWVALVLLGAPLAILLAGVLFQSALLLADIWASLLACVPWEPVRSRARRASDAIQRLLFR